MTERLCIVTRHAVAPEQRVRFVIDPEGSLAPDLAEKLPGRGAYVTADPELLRQAVSRRHFRRHLGEDLRVPVDGDKLCAQVEALLQARFIQQLGLARRANLAVIGSGSMRDEAWITGLLIADDASPREASALKGAVQPDWVEEGLPAATLGAAFSRPSVAYLGLRGSTKGPDQKLTGQIRASLGRWRPFLAGSACQTIG